MELDPKLLKIPIGEYEEDIETEPAKGKKKEILDLFQNYNSEEELNEIKSISDLHEAYEKDYLELIKIYLSKTIENESSMK